MPGTRGVDDYPEHLNPFHEEDNHNFLRFWKNIKKKRSNSFSQGFKDLRNNIGFRSMARRKKPSTSSGEEDNKSPPVLRRNEAERAQQIKTERSTLDVPYSTNRYVYQGSITPLPRSRFQSTSENSSPVTIRSKNRFDPSATSTPNKAANDFRDHRSTAVPFALPGLTRGPFRDSRRTSESTNPFDHDDDDDVVTPTYNQNTLPNIKKSSSFNNKMGTYPRKKRRAPPPPSVVSNADGIKTDASKEILNVSDPVFATELRIDEDEKSVASNQNEQSHDSGIELNTTADMNQTVSSLEHETAGSSTTIDKTSDEVQWVSNELYEISSDKKDSPLDLDNVISENEIKNGKEDENTNIKEQKPDDTMTKVENDNQIIEAKDETELKIDENVKKDSSSDLDNIISENGIRNDKEDQNTKTEEQNRGDAMIKVENGNEEANNQITETNEEVELKINENIDETEKAKEESIKTEVQDAGNLASKIIENNDQNKYQDTKEVAENKHIEQAGDVEINENKQTDTKDDSNNNNSVSSSVRIRIAQLEQQNGYEDSKKNSYKKEVNGSPTSIHSGEVDIHIPNPIPKPRRSKCFSTSSSNSSEQ